MGFTDLGWGTPGTDSSSFSHKTLTAWRTPFYARLAAHAERAGRAPRIVAFSGKRQFTCLFASRAPARRTVAAPASGVGRKRQRRNGQGVGAPEVARDCPSFQDIQVSETCPAEVGWGRQRVLPSGWPLPLQDTEVWVMSSTSGAAALSRAERFAPWQALADRLATMPWHAPDGKGA